MVRKRDEGKTWLSWMILNTVWRRGFIGGGSGRKGGKKGQEIRAGRKGGKKEREKWREERAGKRAEIFWSDFYYDINLKL